ncbi:MAG: RusA family crossover junction endodeoxyribonuclease [Sphingobacteriales bacterium JAD_PAG50586_3]|nr:MAG: RusA family crossover junction endodeoxyribonuclease [Sphingobacteriales bacterium JAD_PAG50586_3]
MLKNLLAMGITFGLSDREAFVDKVSGVIQNYKDNPEEADKMAVGIVNYLEELKDNIRLQTSIKQSVNTSNVAQKQDIDNLIKAIKDLTIKIDTTK